MALSATERRQRARVAAHAQHAGGATNTTSARAAADQRFLDQVDERFPGLPEKERQRRAASLRKEFYARLNYASLKARAAKNMKSAPGSTTGALTGGVKGGTSTYDAPSTA